MKIRSLSLRNFLSFGEQKTTINLSDFNTIVGPNGSGKTNVFRALSYLEQLLWEQIPNPDPQYYHVGASELEIEVSLILEPEEAGAIADFLVLAPLSEAVNTQGGESQLIVQQSAFETATKLRETIARAFSQITLGLYGHGKKSEGAELYVSLVIADAVFYMDKYGSIRASKDRNIFGQTIQFARFLYDSAKEADPRSDFESQVFPMLAHNLKTKYISATAQNWFDLNNVENRIGADKYTRSLRQFLFSRGYEKSSVRLVDLLGLIFDSSVVSISELRSRPQAFTGLPEYLGISREALLRDNGRDLNVVLFNLKNSMDRKERQQYDMIKSSFRDILGGDYDFDVVMRTRAISRTSVQGQEQEAIREVAVLPKKDSMITLEFAAAGVVELLLVLTTVMGQSKKILLLDEPALNLHPSMQRKLLEYLDQSSRMSSNQIILITHSPYMIDVRHKENLWRFSADSNGETRISNVGAALTEISKDQSRKKLGLELSKAEIRSLLFARGAIFVEGPSDKYVIERLDKHLDSGRKKGKIDENEWSIAEVGGKRHFWLYVKLTKILGLDYVCITDFDALMSCAEEIEIDPGKKIRTSSVIRAIQTTDGLAVPELDEILNFERDIKNDKEGNYWYPNEIWDNLARISMRHSYFILKTDLEGALDVSSASIRNKPLQAINSVEETLREGRVSPEFVKMIDYIDSKISDSATHPFLRLGILIIGSLFWDTRHNRGQWRNSRLDLEKKFFVRVPIRYGRKSGKRANTYTMVFSPSCEKGQAIAVECKSPVSSVQDILAEALRLWEAEGGENGSIAGNWGAVGIMVNPVSNINQKIVDGWTEFVSKEKDYAKFEFQPKEGPVINNEGILQLDWPSLVSGEELPFDMLLATATAPTLDRASLDYPSVQTIATAWNEHREEQYYFRCNRQNGITTFEDEAIEQLLQK